MQHLDTTVLQGGQASSQPGVGEMSTHVINTFLNGVICPLIIQLYEFFTYSGHQKLTG